MIGMLRSGQNTIRPWFPMLHQAPPTPRSKMNESFVHTAHMSSDHACAQDGYFERPHPTIIGGDKGSGSGWFFVGFGVGGHLTRN